MEQDFPDFNCIRKSSDQVVWVGVVQPLQRSYELHVDYRPASLRQPNPRVWVTRPLICRHPVHGVVPHTYANREERRFPLLCLEFHRASEWDPSMPIATSIIPWACHWLSAYEGWQLTGVWEGDQIHPGDEEYQRWEESKVQRARAYDLVQVCLAPPRGRKSLGRRLMCSASSVSMAAALEESMQQV